MNGNTMKKKMISLLLVAAMVLTTLGVATLGNTAYAAENEITITVTVSNASELAKDAAGNPAVNLPVTVPADGNGTATVDAALKALHAVYCPNGYVTSESAYGLAVQKLWGVENGGSYLFAINGVGCSSGVGYDYVGNGDHLTAIVMKDLTYWSDLVAAFDKTTVSAKVGEQVELALTYDAVTYDANWNAAHVATPVVGANVYVAGTAEPFAVTDTLGKSSISFDKAGTYIVTASGVVKMQVQDWSQGGAYVEADAPISAPACVITVTEAEKKEEIAVAHKIEKPVSKYEQGSKETWSFKGDGAYADFIEIKVDGKTVEKKHYTVKEGSTIVTLSAAYLDSLKAGEHKLEMVWKTGTAEVLFVVAAEQEEEKASDVEDDTTAANQTDEQTEEDGEKAPATADASQIGMYLMMLIGAAGTAYVLKKQK